MTELNTPEKPGLPPEATYTPLQINLTDISQTETTVTAKMVPSEKTKLIVINEKRGPNTIEVSAKLGTAVALVFVLPPDSGLEFAGVTQPPTKPLYGPFLAGSAEAVVFGVKLPAGSMALLDRNDVTKRNTYEFAIRFTNGATLDPAVLNDNVRHRE